MKQRLFSVVVPVYNAEGIIGRALDSIKRQTFTDYEIIIINDGSIDRTKDIVVDYFKINGNLEHIFIDSIQNRGVGYSRNIGLKESRGEYIAFLDADDIWYPEKLERVYRVLKGGAGIDLICHNAHIMREGKAIGELLT